MQLRLCLSINPISKKFIYGSIEIESGRGYRYSAQLYQSSNELIDFVFFFHPRAIVNSYPCRAVCFAFHENPLDHKTPLCWSNAYNDVSAQAPHILFTQPENEYFHQRFARFKLSISRSSLPDMIAVSLHSMSPLARALRSRFSVRFFFPQIN